MSDEVRIVGGTWRGRPIATMAGRAVTRPTTGRTREQVASMVLSARGLDLGGTRVLDAFAGSGALGLELLSRGAASCTFVERDRRACGLVRDNARALGATDEQARVTCGDVFSLARSGRLAGGPFSVVMLDPPYASEAKRVSGLVEDLHRGGLLNEGALVVYERSAKAEGLSVDGLELVKSKSRGTTGVDLYKMGL